MRGVADELAEELFAGFPTEAELVGDALQVVGHRTTPRMRTLMGPIARGHPERSKMGVWNPWARVRSYRGMRARLCVGAETWLEAC